jgi:acetylornithine deacetylase/succinyl-diaminopimelate desuccinylase-like protein
MYRILSDRNAGLKDDALALARELVMTPSPSLEEGGAADLVEAAMRGRGYDKVFRDECGNVVGVVFGREAEPTVLLNSHMDTVAAEPGKAWAGSPLSGRIQGGRLYGLGAGDCKAGLAAQVFTAMLLRRALLPLRGNLVVAATVAEEMGGSAGVRGLMQHTLPDIGLRPSFAILGEPTGLGLYYGHDGWAELEIRVSSANPFQVRDAADAIVADFASDPAARRPSGGIEGLRVGRPLFDESDGLRRAVIRLGRRLNPAEDVDEVLEQVCRAASQAVGGTGVVAVDVAVRQESRQLYTGCATVVRRIVHAWATDPFHPFLTRARQSLAAAGCDARPGRWRLGRLGMGTAGGVLTGEFGVPAIGYGPGDEAVVHAAGESVEVAKLAEAIYGTAAMVHGLVGVPVFGWTSDDI